MATCDNRSLNMLRFYTVIYWRGARRFFFQHFWGGPSSIILAYFTFRKALLRWSQERHGSMNIQTFIWHCNYKVINKWMIYRAFFFTGTSILLMWQPCIWKRWTNVVYFSENCTSLPQHNKSWTRSTTFDFTGENYNCSITLHLEPLHVVLLGQTV